MTRLMRMAASLALVACAWAAHAMSLMSPTGISASLNPELSWSGTPDASSYNVLVQNTAGVAIYENLAATSHCITGGLPHLPEYTQCTAVSNTPLMNGATYAWFVQPVTASGTGAWVGPLTFTVTQIQPVPGSVTLIGPMDGSLLNSQPNLFTWTAASGVQTNYRLEIWVDGGDTVYSSVVTYLRCGVQCVSEFLRLPLSENTHYQWRVIPFNTGGDGPASATYSFTLNSNPLPPPPTIPPEAPTIHDPVEGSSALFPVFRWIKVAGATSYTLLVQNTQGVAICETHSAEEACPALGTECAIASTTPLVSGQSYVAFVNASNTYGMSAWSFSRPVRIDFMGSPLAPPMRISPNGAVTTATPTYSWNAVADAVSYHLLVQNTSGVAVDVRVTSSEAACASASVCSFTPSAALMNGNTYSWFVQAVPTNTAYTGNWSDMGTITVSVPGFPPAPVPLAPVGTVASITPTFAWSAISGATSYYLLVQNTNYVAISLSVSPAAAGCVGGMGTCSFVPTLWVPDGVRHSWFVNATNGVGTGPWSAATTFRISGRIRVPTPIAPMGSISSPTFSWNAITGATSYYLLVQNMAGVAVGVSLMPSEAGCPTGTGECSFTPMGGPWLPVPGASTPCTVGEGICNALATGSTYSWFVDATDYFGAGPWSDATPITISETGPPVPPPPVTLSPTGTVATSIPTFTWNASPGAGTYELLAQNTAGVIVSIRMTAAVASCPSGMGVCSYTPYRTLPGLTSLAWFVRASNAAGTSEWSVGRMFAIPSCDVVMCL